VVGVASAKHALSFGVRPALIRTDSTRAALGAVHPCAPKWAKPRVSATEGLLLLLLLFSDNQGRRCGQDRPSGGWRKPYTAGAARRLPPYLSKTCFRALSMVSKTQTYVHEHPSSHVSRRRPL